MSSRPPIITVMGHIDHGKTTLLDALRNTNVQGKESGGITQHIGAYQIEHQGKKITFIDTPGHAAFASMRSRGAQVTDLVILVVDAVESVKPQTKECLRHIKEAKVPFMVAINKMDLPNAIPETVKKDLADSGTLVEGYGGDVVTVPVSAKTKKGIPELLEMIFLVTEMQGLKADPNGPFQAVVIESVLDKKQGALATIIVKEGTLKVSDEIKSNEVHGKVKALLDDRGRSVKKATPGQPVQVLGFKKTPQVGSLVVSKDNVADSSASSAENSSVNPKTLPETPEDQENQEEAPTLKIVLKADADGTLEAITQNLGDDITLISSGVGDINESDVLLAQSTKASIISFRVKTLSSAKRLAEIEGVLIKNYLLIYQLLEDLQQQILKILEPTIDEQELGVTKIIAEFTAQGGKVAGCEIISGKISVGDTVHLMRNKEQVANAKIKSIHLGKEAADKAKKGQQCGLSFTQPLDFKIKDTLQAYTVVK